MLRWMGIGILRGWLGSFGRRFIEGRGGWRSYGEWELGGSGF